MSPLLTLCSIATLCSMLHTHGLMAVTLTHLPSLPFVLKHAGKTVLCPGGTAATQQLRNWANTNDILEVSPRRDLSWAEASVHAAILLEAILTHQPDAQKEEILQSLSNHTHQLLLHDVCIQKANGITQIRQDMTHALGTGFYALTIDEWKELVQRSGYRVAQCQYGPLQSMSPKFLIQDEGWRRTLRIVWNIVTHKQWRGRVKLARTTMASYKDSLGYIILRAVKE